MNTFKAFIFLSLFFVAAKGTEAVEQPNLVFVVLDDVSFKEIGAFRTKYYTDPVLTPHLDRFAESAVRLTNLHAPSSICTPARYSYMTGNYAGRAQSVLDEAPEGLYSFVRWNSYLDPEDPHLLPRILKEHGYTTGMVGKWHISEIDQSFPDDIPASLMEDNPDPRDPEISRYLWGRYEKACARLEKEFSFDHVSRFTEGNAKDSAIATKLGLLTHNPEWVVEGGLEFIEANKDQPFFLYLAITLLHDDPITPLATQSTMLTPAGYLEKPVEIISPRKEILTRARAAGLDDKYAGNLWMDELFGALIDKLEQLGLRENTMVVLTSDHSLDGKGTCYDQGTQSLTMVSWPQRIAPGRVSDALLSAIDHYPTLLDAAGIQDIPHVDGLSYLPILTGEKEKIREAVFFELGDMRGIRTEHFKFIVRRPVHPREWEQLATTEKGRKAKQIHDYYFRDFGRYLATAWSGRSGKDFYLTHAGNFFDRDQLYYLDNDPDEMENLSSNPDYQNILTDLKERLSVWLQSMPGGEYPL